MPELPEVEILARELRRYAVGRTVACVTTTPDQRLEVGHEQLPELSDQRLMDVRRFGKRLALDFSGGLSLLTHLMMVGQWRFSPLAHDVPPDPKLTIEFSDGTRLYLHGVALRYQRLLPTDEVTQQEEIQALGPDALSPGFTADGLASALAQRNAGIKAVLLEQGLIGGIGNTYADEALYLAGIHPRRPASDLTREEAIALHAAVVQVMREAIEHGGASEMAFVHLDGSKGHYQDVFRVKEREGQACSRCGSAIVKERIAGRPTYYCPGHQRL
ncbi:MAG: bifunctional DNA-formamidopyrimidine glycosylase/DNA-(apurinic or apyrimidinic site) lyase [Anaerolineae bacterium]|nr:bifunctional DNA-formamidopyrimidine glycosylase/DNA-(apurinic or apyrimidinic site) lyase [Anaerolineae bacterium]